LRTNLVMTFVGDDKPGLVEKISEVVNRHNGNWLESRMIQLSGKFSGIIRVGIDETHLEHLTASLSDLNSEGLAIHIEAADSQDEAAAGRLYGLQMLGLDRPGLVHEVSLALAAESINVVEMETNVLSAAMTGEQMFSAEASVEVPDRVDVDLLHERLEALSRELAVDIELGPANTT
jgi:glycine cleavage system regulatory protein